ncbi:MULTISPECIES: hypothetical protein [unclassified Shewanella]|uniref:hypothetical protein n=1 Tax=unclassified Shewanella TaxID=196818 RepID=UPI001BBE6B86|nr:MULTISPECIES: hypothetical protein [unclassified Shewanella]GIU05502.1 hypothetical protein TUM4444_01960 [Shewanella sp. MBTL60-112-B1]GIU23929.1 hypothetical protein TUM4445_00410 [Shewanella sp. MBTL60-112-B2]
MNKAISKVCRKVNQMNKQQVITAAVLILLVVAVQVSTDRAGDWMFIGFNLIEFGSGNGGSLSTVSDVALSDGQKIGQLIGRALECLISSIIQ